MLHKFLEQRLREAVAAVLPDADTGAVLVRPCPEPRFGDYQANALMALAKARKMNPRRLAGDVAARLDVAEWCEPVEIAGAGFLNFRLKIPAIAQALESVARGGRPLVEKRSGPAPSSLISVRPTRPSRCTSAIFVRPFWAIPSPASPASSATAW